MKREALTKPSDVVNRDWRRTFGCAETEEVAHAVVEFLVEHGDVWDVPFRVNDIAGYLGRHFGWKLDHEHPDGTYCLFLLDYCVLQQSILDALRVNESFVAKCCADVAPLIQSPSW